MHVDADYDGKTILLLKELKYAKDLGELKEKLSPAGRLKLDAFLDVS